MSETEAHVSTYAHALYNALGQPSYILDASPVQQDMPGFQLWFYDPGSKSSATHSSVYTAGLSDFDQGGPCPRVEVSLQVEGKFTTKQLDQLGRLIGATLHRARRQIAPHPNLLLRNLPKAILPGRKDALFIEGAGRRPLWVELPDYPVRVLHMVLLFPEEVKLVSERGAEATYTALIEQEIAFQDFAREKLRQIPTVEDAIKSARVHDLNLPYVDLWMNIRSWYRVNAPFIFSRMAESPPNQADALARYLGIDRPAQLPDSWERPEDISGFLAAHRIALYAGYYLPPTGMRLERNPHFLPGAGPTA